MMNELCLDVKYVKRVGLAYMGDHTIKIHLIRGRLIDNMSVWDIIELDNDYSIDTEEVDG